MNEAITVVTATRDRPNLVRRAIASVRAQDYPGIIQHVLVIDDDEATERVLTSETTSARRRLVTHRETTPAGVVRRHGDRRFVYPRLAHLLNVGVRLSTTPWVGFLDDDNEYEPEHLSSLVSLAYETGSPAVHAARQVVWPDGAPYMEPLFPGAPSPEEGARLYELMCERGVWVRGTNVLRDRVDAHSDPSFRNSTVMSGDDPMFLVDQNLWLIRRKVLLAVPVPEAYSDDELGANTCPDDKFLEALVRANVRIEGSGLPTVRYYLGGISNGDEQPKRQDAKRP